MADGPRCKRRKQANPKRNSVPNVNGGLEASSDSDDEDKLHIVEEEGPEAGAKKPQKKVAVKQEPEPTALSNGVKVKEEEEEEEEEDDEEDEEDKESALLQQGDTAVIYPQAPDERGAETGADENGTPDALPLHICPYCSRGYKRNASLKEHIKYRHETSDDNYNCNHCSYTFTYRSQLERHMSHHRGAKLEGRGQTKRYGSGSGGTRKFKCNECSKAFKYKHHLKEHLRIHSGEKPYECSNCHKRFSHSGSYSSHISSKKCAAAHFPNGLHLPPLKPHQIAANKSRLAIAPARAMDSKPLQEHIPVTQIKSEPLEQDIKPVLVPSANGVNRSVVGPGGVAMVVPTVGLVSPIGINLNDLQNVLGKVLANGTPGKQGFVVQQPQQQIISLPAFVDHDGTTKIIINYSISPTAATTANSQPASFMVKNSPPAAAAVPIFAAAPIPSKTEQACALVATTDGSELPTDLSISKRIKEEPMFEPVTDISDNLGIIISKTESVAAMPSATDCLLCEECPEHLEAVHLLQHRKAANCEAVDSAALDPSFADLLSEAGVILDEPSADDDVLSVLKAAFASNPRPSNVDLEKVAAKVRISSEVVRKWFAKMNKGRKRLVKIIKVVSRNSEQAQDLSLKSKMQGIEVEFPEEEECVKPQDGSSTQETANQNGDEANGDEPMEVSEDNEVAKDCDVPTDKTCNNSKPQCTSSSPKKDSKVTIKTEPEDRSIAETTPPIPLDLSLPRPLTPAEPAVTAPEQVAKSPQETIKAPHTVQVLNNLPKLETTPLNLACINKDQLEPRALYVTTPQSGNSNFVTATQIPTLVAIAGQGTVGCLSAINPATKQRTILIPQLTYTYGNANNASAAKTVVLNGHKAIKVEKEAAPPTAGADTDLESKKKKFDSGVFPCDLCNKVFQKASSLLRHKYEHTGKRPHECVVCKKAFKHKHHLIEHARLHTGIKPYECDKCGKKFSHSGSYSQHMNHRYSYCKRNAFSSSSSCASASSTASSPPFEPRDHMYSAYYPPNAFDEPRSNGLAHSEEDDDEEDEDEEYEDMAMCVDDIRVVQVDEDNRRIQEESEEEMQVNLWAESDEEDSENSSEDAK
ncbi:unnamed protein product [Knipowitschia caucasica]|uniref:Uncharacterized protein n=1 Tax=Knipowitschia caucasica TaxID=637954 RepID=A0AAV2JWK0_KNICA